jgi:hypothetical protein
LKKEFSLVAFCYFTQRRDKKKPRQQQHNDGERANEVDLIISLSPATLSHGAINNISLPLARFIKSFKVSPIKRPTSDAAAAAAASEVRKSEREKFMQFHFVFYRTDFLRRPRLSIRILHPHTITAAAAIAYTHYIQK